MHKFSHKKDSMSSAEQRGVAALEFALVFTIVWAVFWSLVCYVAPLIVLQTMHRASAEGARVGAMIAAGPLRCAQAKVAADKEMKSLPTSWTNNKYKIVVEPTDAACNAKSTGANLLTVTITLDYAENAPLKPIINLPGIGTIPALPKNLRSEASLMLN